MAWITSTDVEVVLQTDLSGDAWIDGLIDHVQGLAESVIGLVDDDDVTNRLKSVFAQIVARFWRSGKAAATNPQGYETERIDDYQYQYPAGGPSNVSGLGLTNREKKDLRRAAGLRPVWALTIDNSPVEHGPEVNDLDDWLEGAY